MELWSFPHTQTVRNVSTEISQHVQLENCSEVEIQEALHYVSTQDSQKHQIIWAIINQLANKNKVLVQDNEKLVEIIKHLKKEEESEILDNSEEKKEDCTISDSDSEVTDWSDLTAENEVQGVDTETWDEPESDEVSSGSERFEHQECLDEYDFVPRRKRCKRVKTLRFEDKKNSRKIQRRLKKKNSILIKKELIGIKEEETDAVKDIKTNQGKQQSPANKKSPGKNFNQDAKGTEVIAINQQHSLPTDSGKCTSDYGSCDFKNAKSFAEYEQQHMYMFR